MSGIKYLYWDSFSISRIDVSGPISTNRRIDILYYARVNFISLIKILDALDGEEVGSECSFEAGGYQFSEIINHLNGEQALAFSRERHSFANGDNQKGKNLIWKVTLRKKRGKEYACSRSDDGSYIGSAGSSWRSNNFNQEKLGENNQ